MAFVRGGTGESMDRACKDREPIACPTNVYEPLINIIYFIREGLGFLVVLFIFDFLE